MSSPWEPPVSLAPTDAAGRVQAEVRSAWRSLDEITQNLIEAWPEIPEGGPGARERHNAAAQQLLIDPVARYLQERPILKTFDAMLECDREVPARRVRARSRVDARFQKLLTQAALDLCEPWRIHRGGRNPQEWRAWLGRIAARRRQAAALLDRYARWTASAMKQTGPPAAGPFRSRELFWRQERAATAILDLEASFDHLTQVWFDATAELAYGLELERRRVLEEGAKTLAWI